MNLKEIISNYSNIDEGLVLFIIQIIELPIFTYFYLRRKNNVNFIKE